MVQAMSMAQVDFLIPGKSQMNYREVWNLTAEWRRDKTHVHVQSIKETLCIFPDWFFPTEYHDIKQTV